MTRRRKKLRAAKASNASLAKTGRKIERFIRRNRPELEVSDSIAREISLVVLIILIILTLISGSGAAGALGASWHNLLLTILGIWGIYLFLGVFSIVALCMIFRKDFNLNFTRWFAISLIFIAVLGYIGLSANVDLVNDPELVVYGLGGYIGFFINILLKPAVGETGARIILFGAFLIAVLMLFQTSILETFGAFFQRPRREAKQTAAGRSAGEQFTIKGVHEVKKAENLQKPIKKETMTIHAPGNNAAEKKEGAFVKQDIRHKTDVAWQFPPYDLLEKGSSEVTIDENLLKANAEKIRDKLSQFNIPVNMRDVNVGPTVMQYAFEPDDGIKLSKITALKDDLALALAAKSIRMEAPIPGKSLVGIEIPNEKRMVVHLKEILESKEFFDVKSTLRFPFGRDVAGKPIIEAINTMPHLLIAGATGSGKSVAINSLLISLFYQNTPQDLKLILVDPKRVELSSYNNLPYLLTPVITDPDKAINALRWTVAEMTRRYKECQSVGVRNRDEYNQKVGPENKMSYLIFVIDELADLMMTSLKKEVETLICRIAQMARAVGIHLVVATQRPSVDVITGLIKANIPARVAFSVVSAVDSRTILDSIGAEDLIGKGDMLYISTTVTKPMRVQGVYVSTEEIEKITTHIRMTVEPDYLPDVIEASRTPITDYVPSTAVSGGEDLSDDQLVDQAVKVIREIGKASASLFQRRLKLGYARAARIVDMLEERGIVGPAMGSKPREIFIDHQNGAVPEEEV